MTDISDESNLGYDEEVEEVEEEMIDDDDINDSSKVQKKQSNGFIKQLVSSKQPFYKMSLPISYSEPRSFLEKLTDMGSFLDIFLETPSIECEEQRFLEILKFYISGWIQQREAKNPFNPIIGEVHTCKWHHKDGSITEYIAEQITHHPPSSSFCMYNQKKGVVFHSYLSPTSKLSGINSLENSMDGKLLFEIPSLGEEYVVEAPKIIVKGIMLGSLQAETIGTTILSCKKTDYSAEIEFKGKGGIFKNKHALVAKVKHSNSKKPLHTIEGKFDGSVTITSAKTGKTTSFFDINSDIVQQPVVLPLEQLEENNSRIVWKHVISNLQNNNEDEAQKQKQIVEENQRTLAKSREGKPWIPKHFVKHQPFEDSDVDFYQYCKIVDIKKEMKE